ncbi:hypothetical protein DBR17_01145 [Sphingomonas sp. HMWF008]|nr:hypothetical protein DBR17_01145 [Sphingomonas sp. HMWF008]
MSHSVAVPKPHAWLPAGAIMALAIDRVLSEVVQSWSLKWFASRAVRPLDALTAGPVPTGWEGQMLLLDRDLGLAVSGDATAILAGAMLDRDVPTDVQTDADRRVFVEMVRICLEDLCRRLAEAFRFDASARWERFPGDTASVPDGVLVCGLGIESHAPLMRFMVAPDTLVEMAKAGLPPPERGRPLAGIACGLAAQAVSVSAQIGRCSLTLADVAGLNIGDVLVFDRALDAPVDLVVNGAGPPLARCTIVQNDDRFDLMLLDSIGG